MKFIYGKFLDALSNTWSICLLGFIQVWSLKKWFHIYHISRSFFLFRTFISLCIWNSSLCIRYKYGICSTLLQNNGPLNLKMGWKLGLWNLFPSNCTAVSKVSCDVVCNLHAMYLSTLKWFLKEWQNICYPYTEKWWTNASCRIWVMPHFKAFVFEHHGVSAQIDIVIQNWWLHLDFCYF